MQNWNVNPAEAIQIQQEMRNNIILKPLDKEIQYIAGTDISLNLDSDVAYAGIIVLNYKTLQPVAYVAAIAKLNFPYIPGLLSFREIPALMQAWEQMPIIPDVVMVDGHGIAHPRRMGIATHFGLIINQPTLGCAKKILAGKYVVPLPEKGNYTEIKYRDEKLGYAFRSRTNVKPVFISPGHLITHEESLQIAQHCAVKYRLPEPTRLAHQLVNRLRTGEIKEGVENFL